MDYKKKSETNFNNYFEWMWEEAQRQGLNKGSWCAKAEFHQNRWIEFARAAGMSPGGEGLKSRDISAYYFLSLGKGLNLTSEQIEEKSGIRFSEAQLLKLKRQAWVEANEAFIDKCMALKPEKLKFIEGIIED